MKLEVPVVDIFAGPGGLGEGFSRHSEFNADGDLHFSVKLSIEKEPVAARTLRLRAFVRAFAGRKIPDCYYSYVRAVSEADKSRSFEDMAAMPEWQEAEMEVWNATLGQVPFDELHDRIKGAIDGNHLWVLVGGPPCQAYSVIGRSRRMGIGEELRQSQSDNLQKETRKRREDVFFKDEKHTLYREYLKIVAIHQPPFFVMENVKGILSSKLDGGYIFDRILQDLTDPGAALGNGLSSEWNADGLGGQPGYRIHSFVETPDINDNYRKGDYLIRSEDYGVPQERHRVILLGIRKDLNLAPMQLRKQSRRTSLSDVIGNLPRLRSGRSGRITHKTRGDRDDSSLKWVEAVKASVTRGMRAEIEKDHPRIGSKIKEVLSNLDSTLGRGAGFIRCVPWENSACALAAWFKDDSLEGVLQHETRDHMDADFARYLFVAAYGEVMHDSPKLRHFPESVLPEHRNAKTEEGRRVFHDRFRVQLPNRAASTVTCHIRKDGHYFIHYDPTQCRSLTVREAARVQTFPDNYFFEGSRTEQYEQVGNAVPPFLAVQLARIVADLVGKSATQREPDENQRSKPTVQAIG